MTFTPTSLLKVFLDDAIGRRPVGRLALRDRRVWFEYDPDFLASDVELSPFRLARTPGVQAADFTPFEGLFGLFNDSLPDGWGRLLLDRRMRTLGVNHLALTPLDRLACVGRGGMGALSYEPDLNEAGDVPTVVELDRLAHEADQVMAGEAETVIDSLLALNGASQGARPKIVAAVSADHARISSHMFEGAAPWLIKFTARGDPEDAGAVEYAYSLMARVAGLDMPPTHLFRTAGGAYFGTQRFDRNGDQRIHMHSLCGLIHADHRVPSLDYDMILRVTGALTRNRTEIERAFTLACFNVLAHNRDDHSKNFAFLMNADGQWRLSPVYDLTFSAGPAGEQSTTVMGEGRNPGLASLRLLAAEHGLKSATDIIDRVVSATRQWPRLADEAGVTNSSKTLIAQHLTL